MSPEEDNFAFKQRLEIRAQRVGVVLGAIDKLNENIQVATLEPLSPENQFSIEGMSEADVAGYLQDFVQKYSNGSLSAENLRSHAMFQGVLTRARVIEDSRG